MNLLQTIAERLKTQFNILNNEKQNLSGKDVSGGYCGYTEAIDQDITSTLTWTGNTAPSGAVSKRISYYRTGRLVTVLFRIEYAIAGNNLTQLTFSLPAGFPSPINFTGVSAGEFAIAGTGYLETNPTTSPVVSRCALVLSGGTYSVRLIASGGNYSMAYGTFQYMGA